MAAFTRVDASRGQAQREFRQGYCDLRWLWTTPAVADQIRAPFAALHHQLGRDSRDRLNFNWHSTIALWKTPALMPIPEIKKLAGARRRWSLPSSHAIGDRRNSRAAGGGASSSSSPPPTTP